MLGKQVKYIYLGYNPISIYIYIYIYICITLTLYISEAVRDYALRTRDTGNDQQQRWRVMNRWRTISTPFMRRLKIAPLIKPFMTRAPIDQPTHPPTHPPTQPVAHPGGPPVHQHASIFPASPPFPIARRIVRQFFFCTSVLSRTLWYSNGGISGSSSGSSSSSSSNRCARRYAASSCVETVVSRQSIDQIVSGCSKVIDAVRSVLYRAILNMYDDRFFS